MGVSSSFRVGHLYLTVYYPYNLFVCFLAVGLTDRFKVKVGLHQGSTLSPFLFAMVMDRVMDRLTDEIRLESPWTMMFADDIMICRESREPREVEVRTGEKGNDSQSE